MGCLIDQGRRIPRRISGKNPLNERNAKGAEERVLVLVRTLTHSDLTYISVEGMFPSKIDPFESLLPEILELLYSLSEIDYYRPFSV